MTIGDYLAVAQLFTLLLGLAFLWLLIFSGRKEPWCRDRMDCPLRSERRNARIAGKDRD